MRRDVYQAIADPTRREILNILSARPLKLNTIAENFKVSRPAISRHIKILTECGLVSIRRDGREHYCEAKLNKLHEVSEWVGHYSKFWNKKMDALDDFLTKNEPKRQRP